MKRGLITVPAMVILGAALCSLPSVGLRNARVFTATLLGAEETTPEEKAKARREFVEKGLRRVKAALAAKDVNALDNASGRLARAGGSRAINGLLSLLGKIPSSADALYWSLAGGIVSFRDEEALSELGKYLKKRGSKPVARDLLIALSRNPSPHVAAALEPLARGEPREVQLLVVDRIGRIRSPRSVDALIRIVKQEERTKRDRPTELMRRAVRGLEWITGENFGPSSVNWEGWWNRHRDRRLSGEGSGSRRHTGTAVDFLDSERDEVFTGLEQAPPRRVVVLSARFTKEFQWDFNKDHIETVLDSMKVPHTIVRREDFMDFDLSTTSAIIINCTQYIKLCFCPKCKRGPRRAGLRSFQCVGCNEHLIRSARLNDEAIEKLRDFVLRGGYLFCEDWNVKEILPRAFPDSVGPGVQLMEGQSVDVIPVRGAGSHPYLRGVFDPPKADYDRFGADTVFLGDDDEEDEPVRRTTVVYGQHDDGRRVDLKHRWQIDAESYSLHVEDRRRVVTLLKSGQLRSKAEGNDAVALAFRPGTGSRARVPPGASVPKGGAPGVVTVVLSHFGTQDTQADEFALQNILLNLLLDAHVQQKKIPGWTAKLEKEIAELKEKKRRQAAAKKKKRSRKRRPKKSS